MNLKEFLQEKQDERYNVLVNEMSLRMDEDVDALNDVNSNLNQFKYITRINEFIEEVTLNKFDLKVFKYEDRNNGESLAFLSDNYVAALIEFKIVDNGIQIEFSNLFRIYRRLMDHIFIDYLLEKYGIIYSDSVQTTSAFNFYQRLVQTKELHKIPYKIFIVNRETGEEHEILNANEMTSTYGYDTKFKDIIYKIEKI